MQKYDMACDIICNYIVYILRTSKKIFLSEFFYRACNVKNKVEQMPEQNN